MPLRPDNWRWRDGPVAAGPAVVFDIDGVLSDAAGRQHFIERPYARLGGVLRRLRRRPADRRGRPPARAARPPTADRAAHRPADPGAAPDAGWLERYAAALGPAHHARLRRLRRGLAGSSSARWPSCAPSASTCASPSRTTAATRHVPRRGRPLRVHPLRLLRLNEPRRLSLGSSRTAGESPSPLLRSAAITDWRSSRFLPVTRSLLPLRLGTGSP